MNTGIIIDEISDQSSIGYSPRQIKKVYNLGNYGDGDGVIVSILDFFANPYLQQNIDIFSEEFSLPYTSLKIYGDGSRKNFNFGAYIEPVVDCQWVHAISPSAEINVIRAKDYSISGAMDAINNALEIGTDIMLMTFQSQFTEEYLTYSDIFEKNCIFVASAGDYGAQVNFPSCDPNCISVGGTGLQISKNGDRISEETAWTGTGGGICTYYEIPEYQRRMSGISEITGGKRGVPDVSSIGDPTTGVSVYHSSVNDAFGWYRTGGTSVSATIVAGIIANILSEYKNEIAYSEILNLIYNLAGGERYTNQFNKYYDITSGNNGRYKALRGYDLCTGLGSLINL